MHLLSQLFLPNHKALRVSMTHRDLRCLSQFPNDGQDRSLIYVPFLAVFRLKPLHELFRSLACVARAAAPDNVRC